MSREDRIARKRAYHLVYYQKNKQKILQRGRIYRQRHPEKIRELACAWNRMKRATDQEWCAKQLRAQRVSYAKNGARYNQNNRNTRETWKERLVMAKGGSCSYCACDDYRLIDFDHRDPDEKEFNISEVLHTLTRCKTPSMESLRNIFSELNKTRLLCCACHRLRTFYNLQFAERRCDTIIISPE